MDALAAGRFVFLDEAGSNTAMDRRSGRALRGQRVDGPVPHGRWEGVALTALIRPGGGGDCPAFDGDTDAATFEHDFERSLVPTPRPGEVAIMDDSAVPEGRATGSGGPGASAAGRGPPSTTP